MSRLEARVKRLEKARAKSAAGGRCNACGGQGRIAIVMPGDPEPGPNDGCAGCGRVMLIRIEELNTDAELPPDLAGSAALGGVSNAPTADPAGKCAK